MNIKRILALLMVLLLTGLFAAALIMAVTGAPKEHLMALFFFILFLSVVLYAMGLITRVLGKKEPRDEDSSQR